MSDAFTNAAGALAASMASACGQQVTYTRGATSAALTMWRRDGPREVQVTGADGLPEIWQSWDWHARAADLSTLGDPQPGDRITAADGHVFEALEIPGAGCWSGGTVLTIHTKRVG